MYDIVLAIPAYNEERFIAGMLSSADRTLRSITQRYKIVVVIVKSSDRTLEIARSVAAKRRCIAIIPNRERNARGLDLMYAFSKYKSKLYCYIDADLGKNIQMLKRMAMLTDRYDVVVGSKYTRHSRISRPVARHLMSVMYNTLLTLLFNDGIRDHQCGFKLFNRRALSLVRRYSMEPHWTWDTEVMLICSYGGMKIHEMPISWSDERHLDQIAIMRRVASDTAAFSLPLLRMFYRFRVVRIIPKGKNAGPGR